MTPILPCHAPARRRRSRTGAGYGDEDGHELGDAAAGVAVAWASVGECHPSEEEVQPEQDYPRQVVRSAIGVTLLLLSLPVGGYGLLYLGAIWTSDTSTGSLIEIGGLLLGIAAALIVAGVVLLRRPST